MMILTPHFLFLPENGKFTLSKKRIHLPTDPQDHTAARTGGKKAAFLCIHSKAADVLFHMYE